MIKNINLKDYIQNEVLIKTKNLNEFDALFDKEKDWKIEAESLKADMLEILKHIEDDNYVNGIESIEQVVYKLKNWKRKIQKVLGEKQIDQSSPKI